MNAGSVRSVEQRKKERIVMKWKRVPTEFLPEKTFLIIKDDLRMLEAKENTIRRRKPKSAADTGTWPPKLKNHLHNLQSYANEERPKTANLERPSVLDPRLLNKLDMSLVSKEVLCNSMTRIQLSVKSRAGGGTTSGSSRRRRSEPVGEKSYSLTSSIPIRQQATPFIEDYQEKSTISLPVAVDSNPKKRRSFEHLTSPETLPSHMEISSELSNMKKQPGSRQQTLRSNDTQDNIVKRGNSDPKKLDDNNNRNGNNNTNTKISSLSTVRKNKSSKNAVSTEIEVFTGAVSKIVAPEPCKTCGRPDQPERFHSHPKGSTVIIKKESLKEPSIDAKPKIAVPKTIQRPVALNFRSEMNKNKNNEETTSPKGKFMTNSPRDTPMDRNQKISQRTESAAKKGPRTVTCYICAREFGTASFPIHEPKCMQKWERENNALPASQRRSVPQRPIVPVDHYDWNTAAWQQSQAQLVPCWKCGRTFLPDRLEIHERSCKATRKTSSQNSPKSETTEKVKQATIGNASGLTTVLCEICGRNFGNRSIKIHELQCTKKWHMENEALPINQRKKNPPKRERSADLSSKQREPPFSPARPSTFQKPTTTCYICGRDFGSASIDIHEPQCLIKWQIENARLPVHQRRDEPQKPAIIYTSESAEGSPVVDWTATTEARWKSHLGQLVPCKLCKRTFNPDRVAVHERSCKGTR